MADADAKSGITFEHVFAEELAYVRDRRAAMPDGDERRSDDSTDRPTTRHELVGLAFSGGGIRSATLNLGILQALRRWGVLHHVDYLSTVSGGGFIGSCLSSLFASGRLDWLAGGPRQPHAEQTGGADEAGAPEPRYVSHLRNNANYLTPHGLVDWARIAGLMVKGILVNFVTIMPFLVFAALAVSAIFGRSLRHGTFPSSAVLMPYTLVTAVAVLLWAFLSPFLARVATTPRQRDLFERSFGLGLLAILAVAAFELQPVLIRLANHLRETWPAADRGALALSALSLLSVAFARPVLERVRKHAALLISIVTAVLGPILPFLFYLYLAERLIYSELTFRDDLARALAGMAGMLLMLLVSLLAVDVNTTSLHGFYRDRLRRAYLANREEAGRPLAPDELPLSAICRDRFDREAVDVAAAAGADDAAYTAPYHLVNTTLNLQSSDDPDLRGRASDFFVFSKYYVGCDRTGYCLTSDLEQTVPDLQLDSAVAISGAAASPNMGTYTSWTLTFLMGLLNVRMGYWLPHPAHLRRWARSHRLGFRRERRSWAAVGDGGEAAAETKVSALQHMHWRPTSYYYHRELLSAVGTGSGFVNVSDGGHLENSGVYELLRRRCRFIIAGDGEADAELRFQLIANLVRYARIDLGVDIEIDLEDIGKGDDGLSRQNCALAVIHYPETADRPAEMGHLLYVKSSLTGDEGPLIDEYRARNPDFPHQSTADQFFSEDQFEAYRSLGEGIVDRLFRSVRPRPQGGRMSFADFSRLFLDLQLALAPTARAEVAAGILDPALTRIEKLLTRPELRDYSAELYPETAAKQSVGVEPDSIFGALDDVHRATLVHVVNLQLKLMESAYALLDLGDPARREGSAERGWMNLFRRWAQAPSFRRGFALCIAGFGGSFQQFCEVALGLGQHMSWREADDEHVADLPAELTPSAEAYAASRRLLAEPGDELRRYVLFLTVAGTAAADDVHVAVGSALVCRPPRDRGTCTLGWHRLRPGFGGGDIYQRALAALSQYYGVGDRRLEMGDGFCLPGYEGRVTTDVRFAEDIDSGNIDVARGPTDIRSTW